MLNAGQTLPAGLVSEQTLRLARARHVYSQQALKEALLAAMPRDAAFEAYRLAVQQPGARLRAKRLLRLLDAAQDFAASLPAMDAGGDTFVVAPPQVFGEGNQRPLQGRQRARYLACFADARIRSRSSALEFEDAIAFDVEAVEAAGMDDRLNLDPALFAVEGPVAYTIDSDEPVLEMAEAFSLVGSHSWAFGHWMWEFLPRYLAACLAGLPKMPVVVDAGMPAQHYQSLQALLPPGSEVIELPAGNRAQVARLWVAPTPMYMPQFERMNERFRWDPLAAHPQRFAQLLAEMNQRLQVAASGPAKLYFARREHRHRKLDNHAEIEAMAVEHGFEVVYPEDLPFADQVARVRAARHIIGPEGSAMFLGFFARPGTRVDILNHPYTAGLPVLTGLLEAIGLDVAVLTGPATSRNDELPHFIDYRIEPEQFAAFLDRGTAR